MQRFTRARVIAYVKMNFQSFVWQSAKLSEFSECLFCIIFAKIVQMDTTAKQTRLYWLLFFISVIVFFLVLQFKGELVTLTLPFVCTFFAKAMDIL
jgi:hypothetical protein